MGVAGLWGLLTPCYENIDCLSSLKEDYGVSLLAVDLSIWVVEAIHALRYVRKGGITENAFLLSIFYKVRKLNTSGIQVVGVIDSDTPNALKVKQRIRQGKGSITYNTFNRQLDLAAQLLRCLGVKVLKSKGEAEALCAALNHENVCDGVITQDSDVFLFGAKTVIRDLKLNDRKKPGDVGIGKIYHMDKIKATIGLDHMGLISLSLFAGSDFTKGIEGVGCKKALPFIKYLNENYVDGDTDDMTLILSAWSEKMKRRENENILEVEEVRMWGKIMKSNTESNGSVSLFPDIKAINEYRQSVSKEIESLSSLLARHFKQKRPDLEGFFNFMQKYRNWGRWTAKKKLLPMLVNFDLRAQAEREPNMAISNHIRPKEIKRKFKKNLLECTWEYSLPQDDALYCLNGFVHEVPLQLLMNAYPTVVRRFLETTEPNRNKRNNQHTQTNLDTWCTPQKCQTQETDRDLSIISSFDDDDVNIEIVSSSTDSSCLDVVTPHKEDTEQKHDESEELLLVTPEKQNPVCDRSRDSEDEVEVINLLDEDTEDEADNESDDSFITCIDTQQSFSPAESDATTLSLLRGCLLS